jgi:hypothetical protein
MSPELASLRQDIVSVLSEFSSRRDEILRMGVGVNFGESQS